MDSSAVDKPDGGGKSTHRLDTCKQKARNSRGGDNTSGKCQAASCSGRIGLNESQKTAQQARVSENVVTVEDRW